MSVEDNKRAAQEGYAAFAAGDAEAAMKDIDDSIEWTVRGDNALTGVYRGKQELMGLWGNMLSHETSVEPHDFIGEGNRVVVLCKVTLDGESGEVADILTYNDEGKLIGFDTLGDESIPNRVFAKELQAT